MELSMPSIVPNQEQPLYFVLCDYGPEIGKAYYETDPDKSDRETVIDWLLHGQYVGPERVIKVDISAGTSKDVTSAIFKEVEQRRVMAHR
jgi:hypothetical protein